MVYIFFRDSCERKGFTDYTIHIITDLLFCVVGAHHPFLSPPKQIPHLDGDGKNDTEDNVVWLRQSKSAETPKVSSKTR